jgi:hypothetical protein
MLPEKAQAELDKLTEGEDLRSKPHYNSDDPEHKAVTDRAKLCTCGFERDGSETER